MQPSHRNFLAASIGAVVFLGSADTGFAQTVSPALREFSSTSTAEDIGHNDVIEDELSSELPESDRPVAFGIEASLLPSFPINGEQRYWIETGVQMPAATPSAGAAENELNEVADALLPEDSLGAELAAVLGQAKTDTSAGVSQSVSARYRFLAAEARDALAGPIAEPIAGPTVQAEATPESAATLEPTAQLELDSEPDVPASEPEPEPAPESASDVETAPDPVILEPFQPEPDTPALEPSPQDSPGLEQVPVLEDQPTSESAADLDITLEAAPVLAAPDYLNADPNPLYFPTEPDDVEIVGNQPISLAQALELARRNSRELRSARLSYERAAASLREAQSQRLPRVTAGADLVHTDLNRSQETTTQVNPFTGEEQEVEIESDDNTTTFSADVQISYDLFTSGQRRASIRAAERNLRQRELQVEVVLEDLRLTVTNAYYDVQETDESVRIARSSLEESLESLRIAEARERAGVGTRFDRLQAEVDAANSQQDLRIALSNQSIARRQLAQVLSIPSGINISAADEVEVAGNWLLSLEESLVLAFRNRAEPEQLLVQREIDEQQRRAELGALGPQLSAFGRYRTQDLLDETRGSSDNEAFEVGLQLDLLLFDGGAARARARQEAIDIEIAESDFADTLEEVRFDVEEAYFQLQSNFENIQTAAQAVELAQESLRLARLRFSAGVGIQSDVITAQADLTEAEFNLVSAILDYNRALVSMQRAVSNLDANTLSNVP